MTSISEGLAAFLSYLREMEECYHIARSNEQEANDQTQDILHYLELGKCGYHQAAQWAKQLQEIRQQRRAAKGQGYQTALIVDWIENNRAVIKALERLLGEVRKREQSAQNRIYHPKSNIKEE